MFGAQVVEQTNVKTGQVGRNLLRLWASTAALGDSCSIAGQLDWKLLVSPGRKCGRKLRTQCMHPAWVNSPPTTRPGPPRPPLCSQHGAVGAGADGRARVGAAGRELQACGRAARHGRVGPDPGAAAGQPARGADRAGVLHISLIGKWLRSSALPILHLPRDTVHTRLRHATATTGAEQSPGL